MEKLTFLGIGPKIGRITLPYFTITVALTIIFPAIFTFGEVVEKPFMVAGIVLMAIGLVFYIATIWLMLPGIRNNKLVTGGAYRLCRNPLYSALILFLIPGLSLLMNSWIIITASIVGYLLFRRFIHEEEELLERIFGDEFRKYRETTPCFFPKLF
jgi:protein-S-isoprenylcysteine O-methyltransferase Ste14